ncbi:MAG: non-hydrolyzing UDP-N-acetylglucosamine 2-epimerase [Candidatus Helarchaeota archaeon]
MNRLIYIVGGARPNFIKIAPLINEMKNFNLKFKLIHTGQHYDYNMSTIFFKNLDIPEPDIHLNVGSASHAVQTANIMIKFEKYILNDKPDLVIVVGDVNSTLACALVAKKLNINVAHIEAGLRSFDMQMPEEINRKLTDQISDLLFITEKSAKKNLKREGINLEKVFFVGNIMIDTLILNLNKIEKLHFYKKFNLKKKNFSLITIHRPSNVDNKADLEKIIEIINFISSKIKTIFPIHPRTQKNLQKFNLNSKLNKNNLIIIQPVGYLQFMNLMYNSRFIITDSGGIQEEATFLKIPTLTLRNNTERPITISKGTNSLVGTDIQKIKKYISQILSNNYKKGSTIEKWDGKTAKRIVEVIQRKYHF